MHNYQTYFFTFFLAHLKFVFCGDGLPDVEYPIWSLADSELKVIHATCRWKCYANCQLHTSSSKGIEIHESETYFLEHSATCELPFLPLTGHFMLFKKT